MPQFIYDKEISENNTVSSVEDKPILTVKGGIDGTTHNKIRTSNLNEKYTFANFIICPSNRLAHAAAVSVAQNPGKTYNPLFVYGPTGVGKTHLIQAIGRALLDTDPEKKVLYLTTENFLNDLVQSLQTNRMREFREKYRKLDLLIIDDIQQISNARETQTEFFNTFNCLFQDSKQIVITSDRVPDDIPNIEERLISRFKGGMVADIAKPLFEERFAILKQKTAENAFNIPDSSLKYIAEIITENVRALEGALQRVNLYTTMKKVGDLTQPEIAKILGKDPNSKRKQIKVHTILKKCAKEYDVTIKDLTGPRRTKEIAFARQVCMYILRDEFGYKLQEISQILARKDHTTAIHAIDKIQSMIESNMTFKEQYDNLVESIQNIED